jgi:hypothetical protein
MFEIVDQPLVDDAVNTAGQHIVDMLHETDVIGIIFAEPPQIVAEPLAPTNSCLKFDMPQASG